MNYWSELKEWADNMSPEKKRELLLCITGNKSVLPFMEKYISQFSDIKVEHHSPVLVEDKRMVVSQIQALFWMIQGKLNFGIVDSSEGQFYRKYSKNGREGLLPPELTFHPAFWIDKITRKSELLIDLKLNERDISELKCILEI